MALRFFLVLLVLLVPFAAPGPVSAQGESCSTVWTGPQTFSGTETLDIPLGASGTSLKVYVSGFTGSATGVNLNLLEGFTFRQAQPLATGVLSYVWTITPSSQWRFRLNNVNQWTVQSVETCAPAATATATPTTTETVPPPSPTMAASATSVASATSTATPTETPDAVESVTRSPAPTPSPTVAPSATGEALPPLEWAPMATEVALMRADMFTMTQDYGAVSVYQASSSTWTVLLLVALFVLQVVRTVAGR